MALVVVISWSPAATGGRRADLDADWSDPAGEPRRPVGPRRTRTASPRRSAGTAGTWCSPRTARTWCRGTATTAPTCTAGTGPPGRPSGSASAAAARTPTVTATPRRRARDGRYVGSPRTPTTWWPGTRTGSTTPSSATSSPAARNGSACRPAWPGRQLHVRRLDQRRQAASSCTASFADNLVPGRPGPGHGRVLHDRETGATEQVSVGRRGAQPDGDSSWPTVSRDGRFVAFQSSASDLVPGDTNAASGHLRPRPDGAQVTTLVSAGTRGRYGRANSYQPSITSSDGRLGGVRLVRRRPGARRHERPQRRVRARPHDRAHHAGERRAGRPAGQRRQRPRLGDLGRAAGSRSTPSPTTSSPATTNRVRRRVRARPGDRGDQPAEP